MMVRYVLNILVKLFKDAVGYKNRDVEIRELSEEQCLVVACDSCGGIGAKEADIIKAAPVYVSRLITCNVLLEILAVGAEPQIITATIANEPEPTSEALIGGIRQALQEADFPTLPLGISTEKYFKTLQTSFGVTVVGLAHKNDMRIGCSKPGDYIYCVGAPRIGDEMLGLAEHEMIQCRHIEKLCKLPDVHDIIPIGSHGISGEIHRLCEAVGLEFTLAGALDVHTPAGPCTCLLFTCSQPIFEELFDGLLVSKVGQLS